MNSTSLMFAALLLMSHLVVGVPRRLSNKGQTDDPCQPFEKFKTELKASEEWEADSNGSILLDKNGFHLRSPHDRRLLQYGLKSTAKSPPGFWKSLDPIGTFLESIGFKSYRPVVVQQIEVESNSDRERIVKRMAAQISQIWKYDYPPNMMTAGLCYRNSQNGRSVYYFIHQKMWVAVDTDTEVTIFEKSKFDFDTIKEIWNSRWKGKIPKLVAGFYTDVPSLAQAKKDSILRGFLLRSFLFNLSSFERYSKETKAESVHFWLPPFLTRDHLYFTDYLFTSYTFAYLSPFLHPNDNYDIDCKTLGCDELHLLPPETLKGRPNLKITPQAALFNSLMLFAELEYDRKCLLGGDSYDPDSIAQVIQRIPQLAQLKSPTDTQKKVTLEIGSILTQLIAPASLAQNSNSLIDLAKKVAGSLSAKEDANAKFVLDWNRVSDEGVFKYQESCRAQIPAQPQTSKKVQENAEIEKPTVNAGTKVAEEETPKEQDNTKQPLQNAKNEGGLVRSYSKLIRV